MDKKHLQDNILSQPYNQAVWQDVLRQVFGVKNLFVLPQNIILSDNAIALSAYELGNFSTIDDRLVGVYEITLKDDANTNIARNKVGLRSLLRNVYKYDVDAALVVFVHGDKWRFSYVSEIRTIEGKMETEPKRYTYLFGKDESCRTAADRFLKLLGKPIHLSDLFDTFSVEKLTKEFFKTYKEFYEKGVAQLIANTQYYPLLINNNETDKEKQEKPIRDFVKKLLGRIVFLHFIQKKGWMGCPADIPEWKDGNPQFMKTLFANYSQKNQFHSKCLKVLFFETLNTDRRSSNSIAPVSLWAGNGVGYKIPYLNGGLFDKDISYENDIDFDDHYFTNLFDFFEQYNFTIDENDPYDNEVGIDPEMLGHIFENLLEENKDKGAFYTPKEIVHYMCRESLIQYLRTNLPECTEDESSATIALEKFIKTGIIDERRDKKNFIVQNAKRIERLLDKVKICDPAIGSGAFPMGMLQEIFKAKTTLDLTLDSATVKKQIIQNSIYGVDIESGAVDIARLRFWLALVVDEQEPQPLPNLDYKIMQGNSLLESFENIDLHFEPKVFEITLVKDLDLFGRPLNPQYSISQFLQTKQDSKEFDLTQLEETYFNSNRAEEKLEIKKKIDAFEKEFIKEQIIKRREDLNSFIKANNKSAEKKKVKEINAYQTELNILDTVSTKLEKLNATNKPYFLWHLYFMDVFREGGFDIVIGNPPYLRIQGIRKDNPEIAEKLITQYTSATGSFDLYVVFVEMGLKLLKLNGVLNYIMPVKWTNSAFGEGLRKLIIKEQYASKFISFEAYQVFNVSTYTALQWFKKESKQLKYYQLDKDIPSNDELGNFLSTLSNNSFNFINPIKLTETPWTLTDSSIGILLDKINRQPLKVSDVFEKIFQGIATSKDSVYFITDSIISDDKKHIIGYSKEIDEEVEIEIGLVKPLLKGEQVHRYEFLKTKNYVIFPYKLNKEKAELYTLQELKQNFPKGYNYLKRNEQVLRMRESGKLINDELWYRYIYPKNLTLFNKEKLICPDISLGSNYAIDENGEFYDTTTLYGYIKFGHIDLGYKYLMALLNSKICWFFLKNTGTVLANGYFRFMPHYVSKFSIAEQSNSEQALFEKLVTKILSLKSEKLDTSIYENKIEAMVFHLYNFTEEEMMLILNSFTDLSIKDKNQIQNEYWNIANNKFQTEI